MKTPKHEPSSSDDKSPRRPRPLKPASWLEEVRPDDDVMAVFYGRSPAKVVPPPVPSPAPPPPVEPSVDSPAPVVSVPVEPVEPAGPATVEPQPVSREAELWSPG